MRLYVRPDPAMVCAALLIQAKDSRDREERANLRKRAKAIQRTLTPYELSVVQAFLECKQ
jgi:hypothetical protein